MPMKPLCSSAKFGGVEQGKEIYRDHAVCHSSKRFFATWVTAAAAATHSNCHTVAVLSRPWHWRETALFSVVDAVLLKTLPVR